MEKIYYTENSNKPSVLIQRNSDRFIFFNEEFPNIKLDDNHDFVDLLLAEYDPDIRRTTGKVFMSTNKELSPNGFSVEFLKKYCEWWNSGDSRCYDYIPELLC